MKKPLIVFWPVLAVFMLTTFGCAALTRPVPTEVEVDQIATSVAGTLAAGEVATTTAYVQLNATADARATQSAQSTQAAATQEATAQASTPPVMPTLTPAAPSSTETTVPTATRRSQQSGGAPAGLTVAYVGSGRNLWVWQGDEPHRLTDTGDVMEVSISDDGAWIAFTRSVDFTRYSLWMVRPDGSEEREVMGIEAFEALPHDVAAITVVPLGMAWQPGTHNLAFSTRPTFEGPGLMLNDDLWLIDADTRERRELLPAGEGGRFYYSPDGEQIALVQPDSISLINADGSRRRDDVLVYPPVSTYSEYSFYAAPVWSSDSTYLRVVIPPPAALEHPEDSTTVWEIPVSGGLAVQLGSVQTAPLSTSVLSPDLSKLAYLRLVGDPAENRRELLIAEADGSNPVTYLTDPMLQFVAWSPDSTRFVFTTGENNRAYLGRVGETPQPLSDTPSMVEVRWIDNERFFFITATGTGFELRLGSVGQPSQLILSETEAQDNFPLYDFTVGER